MSLPLNSVAVMDDVVPEWLQDHIELIALGQSKDKKLYTGTMPFKTKYESTAITNNFAPMSFVHILKSNTVMSDYLSDLSMLPQIACECNNLKLMDIVQARMFITTPHDYHRAYYEPHTDLQESHTVCIYYVNDAEGDTYFFHEGEIVKQVSPKKGRLIAFNGEIMHAGGVAVNGPRCIINFDLDCR